MNAMNANNLASNMNIQCTDNFDEVNVLMPKQICKQKKKRVSDYNLKIGKNLTLTIRTARTL